MDITKAVKYVSDTISSSERKEFETWLKTSDQNRAEFDRFRKFWNDLKGAYSETEVDVEKAWNKVRKLTIDEKEKVDIPNRQINPWFVLRVASIVLLIVSIGLGIYFLNGNNSTSSWYAKTYISTDSIKRITLSDGSVVFLNTGSRLKIARNFNKKYRKVFLEGEAFFTVKKDTEHSFKVFSGNTITEVLGTSFNVNSQNPDVRVTLLTGKVAFYLEEDIEYKMFLFPGQHGVFNSSTGLFLKDTISGMNNIAWKTKRMEFIQTPMNELCNELSTYFKKEIVFDDMDDYKGNFTGVIDNIPLDETIDIIELTMGIKAIQYKDSIVFSFQNNKAVVPQ